MRFPSVIRVDGRVLFGLIVVFSVCGAVAVPVPSGATESGSIVWVGGTETNIRSGAKQVLERPDGSILIAGHGNLEKIQGFGLVAVTGAGEKLWQRIYGTGLGLNQPLGLSSGPAGSTLLYGSIYDPSVRGGTVPWLARLDDEGVPVWERRWDGPGLYRPSAFDAGEDGSVVMVGHGERTSPWLVRLHPEGKIAWTQRMTRSGAGFTAAKVGLTDDHGILVTGSMDRDAWAARLSGEGDAIWSVRVGAATGVERGIGIVETPDGGALMAAGADSLGADAALLLVRFDSSGRVLWQGALGGPGFDQPRVAAPGDRGEIWVIGAHRDADAPAESATPWIIHIDADGNVLADVRLTEPGIVRRFDRETAGVTALRSGGAVLATGSMEISLAVRVLRMDDVGRTIEAFPFLESRPATYRRVELPVQSAGFEVSSIEVAATTVASETRPVPFNYRQDWSLHGNPGRVAAAPAPPPRPLPDSVDVAALEEPGPAELLLARRFKKLDRTAEGLVESRERNPHGWMEILGFYQSLDVEGQPLLGHGMEASADLLEEWLRERPDSIAARVALADAYGAIAWKHRGSGLGREVTAEGAMNKATYLEVAWTTLTEVYDQRPSDPHYWSKLVSLSHTWGRTPPFSDEVLASALEAAPDYLSVYLQEAHFRLPQWGGGIRGAENFAASMTDRAANPFGEELYARIAVSLARGSARRRVFGDLAFDWVRVRDGLRLINERYPERLNHHWAAFMAVLAGDREETRRYLTAPDGGYGPDVRKIWKSESAYLGHLRWASRPPGGEWARQPPEDWPDLAVVIEPGSDPAAGAEERLGVLVHIDGESTPVLVMALDRSTAPPDSVEATLELLRRSDRIGGWSVRPRSSGGSAVGGLTEAGKRVSGNTIRDRQVVFTRVPDAVDILGVPALRAAALEGLGGEIRIVGCAPGEPGCRQRVLPYGRVVSGGSGGLTIGIDRWGFESTRLGSPVLDALGSLVGLVIERRFEGSMSSDRDTYRLTCIGIEEFVRGGLSAAPPALDSRSAGRQQIERATLSLLGDRRWSDLEWLGDTVVGLRTDDGSWVGQGFVDAFGQISTDPYRRRDTEWFDEVGGLIQEWAAASPDDPAPMAVAVIHHLRVGPPPPKNRLWSHEDAAAEREARYRTLGSMTRGLIERYPDDILVRRAAVRWATTGGDEAQFLDALRGFEAVAPDLAPVVADVTIGFTRRNRRSVEETTRLIESIRVFAGPETAACLYGLVFKNRALRDKVDPDIDLRRVADEYEIWVDGHPGDDHSNRRLVKLLCDIGETDRAASRLEISQCSEVRVQGNTWSPEICRECFGGAWVPRPGTTEGSSTAD